MLRSKGLQLLLRKPVRVFTGKQCWRGLYCSLMECEKRTWHRLSCDLRGSKQRDILCRGCQSESHSFRQVPEHETYETVSKRHLMMSWQDVLSWQHHARLLILDTEGLMSLEVQSSVLGRYGRRCFAKMFVLRYFLSALVRMILWLFFGTQHVHVYICLPFFNPLLIVNRIPFCEYSTPQWVLEWFDPLNSASGGKGLYGYGMVWHFFNGIKVAPLTRAGNRWFYLFVSGVLGATLRLREGHHKTI